jgi:hypothetical protein
LTNHHAFAILIPDRAAKRRPKLWGLDGLDVALCRIRSTPQLGFELVAFESVPLPAELRRALAEVARLDVAQ